MVLYQDWNSFSQSIPIQIPEKRFFRLQANVKVVKESAQSYARLWVRMHNAKGETIFFNNMENPIQSNNWETYVIDGEIDATVKQIYFGGLCESNGTFYFNDFQFYIQINDDELEQVSLENPNFKGTQNQSFIPGWQQGIGKKQPVAINNYTFHSEKNKDLNDFCLKIKGKNIFNSNKYSEEVNSKNAYNIVFTLDKLTKRIIKVIQDLSATQIDTLTYNYENTIGNLLIHMTAIEFYYQVSTFKDRKFNDSEKEKWQGAMDLTKEAKEEYKGHDVNYYIEKHLKVREKTIELFKKVDDQWFEKKHLKTDFNNHYCWLHVIEHYGYHLGQINILKRDH